VHFTITSLYVVCVHSGLPPCQSECRRFAVGASGLLGTGCLAHPSLHRSLSRIRVKCSPSCWSIAGLPCPSLTRSGIPISEFLPENDVQSLLFRQKPSGHNGVQTAGHHQVLNEHIIFCSDPVEPIFGLADLSGGTHDNSAKTQCDAAVSVIPIPAARMLPIKTRVFGSVWNWSIAVAWPAESFRQSPGPDETGLSVRPSLDDIAMMGEHHHFLAPGPASRLAA
jgi:hypothetical protein